MAKKKGVRVSYSSISRFKECPEKYFLSKKYKSKVMGSALPFGKAIDAAIEFMLLNKDDEDIVDKTIEVFSDNWFLKPKDAWEDEKQVFDSLDYSYYMSDFDANLLTHEDDLKELKEWSKELLDREDALEAFTDIRNTIKAGQETNENESRYFNRVNWLCLQVKGELMIEAFYDQIIPKVVKVHSVQESIEMSNTQGDAKTGFIDCVLDYDLGNGEVATVIFDIKTASRFYDLHKLDTSEQLRGYLVAKPEYDTNYIGYIVLLKAIKADKKCNKCGAPKDGRKVNCTSCGEGKYTDVSLKAETQVLYKQVPNEHLESLLDDDASIISAIKHNIRYKNPANCMLYNRKCDYYAVCWEGKKAEDLPHLESKE